jgi:replicative DNA helicase
MSDSAGGVSSGESDPREKSGKGLSSVNPYHEIGKSVSACIAEIEDLLCGDNGKRLLTGWRPLDQMTGGLAPGKLWVVASLPGAGKTTLLSNLVDQLCLRNRVPSLVHLYESGVRDLMLRMVCESGGIFFKDIERYGRFVDKPRRSQLLQVKSFAESMIEAPLILGDSTALNTQDLRNRAAEAANFRPLEWIAIDDFTRFRNLKSPEIPDAGISLEELKNLACELQIPILLSTAMRNGADVMAAGRSLFLSDICDATEVEKHADVVCILGDASADEGFYWSTPNYGNNRRALEVVRNRSGGTGRIGMELCHDTLRFNAVPLIATTSFVEEEREILTSLREREDQAELNEWFAEAGLDWPEATMGSDEIPRAIDHSAASGDCRE